MIGADDVPEPCVFVISGLPRSGTSMMMRMLEAGGLPVLVDGERVADDDNPRGYYEYEPAKRLRSGEASWIGDEASGRAVKVVAALLRHLPESHSYRVILMRRQMSEILASQRAMLMNRGEDPDAIPEDRMAEHFSSHLRAVMSWAAQQPNMELLEVDYNEMVRNGGGEIVAQIVSFIGIPLDADAMSAVIEPGLYRNRTD